MVINITIDALELGKEAGKAAAETIQKAITDKGYANVIFATGTSQFETLNQLVTEKDIDWSKVVMFHLDEYIDLPVTHVASFRKYLKERFLEKVPSLKGVYLIDGEKDPDAECLRLGELINQHPIDIALVGIGENCHLAFNDPPADFTTEQPYHIVELDELCRKQQLAEGWFSSLEEVPTKAISMSIQQIMKSKNIVCSVPDHRKATAVKNCLEQSPDQMYPASILQQHPNCKFYFDKSSASLLSEQTVVKAENNAYSFVDK
ncbi:MAG TPA: glucosamine-6-phosphate deaminase [Chitinophagaceae bacterium]|nr:glucosamine-6-phosphate deaminase [Chitinophagaceae bacterium]